MFTLVKTATHAILVPNFFVNQSMSDAARSLGYRFKSKNGIDGFYKPIKKHNDSDVSHMVDELLIKADAVKGFKIPREA